MVFGRKRQVPEVTDADVDAFVDDLTPEERALEDAELLKQLPDDGTDVPAAQVRPQGPWDAEDAPEGERLDLGALQVTVLPGVEVRLEVSPEGQVVAVTFVHGDSTAQLNVFAAPRTEGIWDEVRAEIAASLNEGGGRASEGQGAFGTELRAIVPNEVPGQGVVPMPARFIGVDGPRWFLRGLLAGPAATEESAAELLIEMVRGVVVVRGTDPLPAREPLPIVLPAEAQQAVPPEPEVDGPPTIALPERGPEITEIH